MWQVMLYRGAKAFVLWPKQSNTLRGSRSLLCFENRINHTVSQTAETQSTERRCIAIIVAAGRGSRVGGEIPKQYVPVGGVPLLRRTLKAFCSHPDVDAVLPVVHPDDRDLFEIAAEGTPVMAPVHGGDTRQKSVRNGLEHLATLSPAPDTVLIHDAARAFVSPQLISGVLLALELHAGAIPALRVVDTLKRGGEDDLVVETVDRSNLWRAQTPQGFRFNEILTAHRRHTDEDMTDDCALAERAGVDVALVTGEEGNVKVTTPQDVEQANQRLMTGEIRTGQGFDVHRYCDGDTVTLCGVDIPHDHGLDGHSDADVAMHALTDALLGAMAEGDIGSHFPPTEEQWRGASSDIFLTAAREMLEARNGRIQNVDVTIICETPKIGPHRNAMVSQVSTILGIDESRVSVKATTTEKLGFTGRGEGIAAQAVATVLLQ